MVSVTSLMGSRLRSPRAWRPLALWAAVLGGALALGVGGALVFRESPPPPSARPFNEIAQSSSTTSNGVRVDALGASYSGTETLLRLRITVEDEALVLGQIEQTGPVRRVIVSGTGYSGPFDGSPLTSTSNRLGELLVHLPPLEPPVDYEGRVPFSISELTVQLDRGSASLRGSWALELEGPPVSTVAEQLRIEQLKPAAIALPAGSATVDAVRSLSETRVSISLPAGTVMLSQPLLEVESSRLAPRSFAFDGAQVTASFDATPFGEPVVLRLGAIAARNEGDSEAWTVALEELLSGIGSAESFEISPAAILDGSASLVVRGEQGTYAERPWVGFVLKGDWHPENGQPLVTDANGSVLELAHVQVAYEKDANGNILEGTTAIGFFVDGDVDLRYVTLVAGPRSEVDRSAYSATLSPAE